MSSVAVAMSGGVDSSVAAAMLVAEGHDVVGLTLKLWGGASDSGCCSVSDVDDARRVAQQLAIDHYVLNLTDAFAEHVVDPYVADHAAGRTPNPCVECNRYIKFDRLFTEAARLGLDLVATGHHAAIADVDGHLHVARGADQAKDQSYVIAMLDHTRLARLRLPVGSIDKHEVRTLAAEMGLRTADKPDSQDVCFVTHADGRARFLADRTPLRPGRVVDTAGQPVGTVTAVELVTIGQRRGLGLPGGGPPRYVVDVDVASATVTVGDVSDLLVANQSLEGVVWNGRAVDSTVLVQSSAHGRRSAGVVVGESIVWDEPQRRVAPGQSVVWYDPGDRYVLGSARAA